MYFGAVPCITLGMSKSTPIHVTAQEAQFIARLRECPELHEQLEAVVNLANNSDAPLNADEAEEKLIDLVQQLGRKTLGSWASKREEQVVQQARSEGQRMQQREKKDSTGGARSD